MSKTGRRMRLPVYGHEVVMLLVVPHGKELSLHFAGHEGGGPFNLGGLRIQTLFKSRENDILLHHPGDSTAAVPACISCFTAKGAKQTVVAKDNGQQDTFIAALVSLCSGCRMTPVLLE